MLVKLPRKSSHFSTWKTPAFGDRGVTRGGKRKTIPRDPNYCGGRRKVPTMSQAGYFLYDSTYASERPQVRTWRRQAWFLPQAPPNPVTPLLGDEILTLQNDFEVKARSTSAQPGEYVVFWLSKLLVADKYPNLRCALNLTPLFGSTYFCSTYLRLGTTALS